MKKTVTLNEREFIRLISESVMNLMEWNVWGDEKESEETDITEDVLRYLSWMQMGKTNATFSIAASKLHDKLMNSICLNHENSNDRKTFAKILNYIKIIHKRVGITKITEDNMEWKIKPSSSECDSDDIWIDINDFEGEGIEYAKDYGVLFETYDGVVVKNYDYRSGSYNGSSGYFCTSAKMSDEMKQKIYDMGLVPALMVQGSYHENFVQSVGVLPEFVSVLKDKQKHDIFFECEFSDYK